MNIIFFTDTLRSGGKERQLSELVKSLTDRGDFNCKVVSMSQDNHYLDSIKYNIDILCRRNKKDPSIFLKFFIIAKKFRPDIIHTWSHMASIYAIPSGKLLGAKIVDGTIRDAIPNLKSSDKRYFWSRVSFPFADAIVANSMAGLKAYRAPVQKVFCIYNGFDIARVNNREMSLLKSDLDIQTSWVVGMVASYSTNKDYAAFFRAAECVLEQTHDITFLAVGENTDGPECRKLVSAKAQSFFRFLGKREDVEEIVNLMDIGVLATSSTHGEGISNSVTEYMALEKPAIASDTGGTKELIIDGTTGFLVPTGDHVALANKILLLLNNRELALQMGKAGRERVKSEFSHTHMIDQYIELYRSLLG